MKATTAHVGRAKKRDLGRTDHFIAGIGTAVAKRRIRVGETPVRRFLVKENSNVINDTSRETVDNPCRQNY